MRAIKYRVWDKLKKKMFHDALRLLPSGYETVFGIEEATSDEVEWLQFTGLHDKNGKEVYEGDILSDGSDDPMLLPVIYDEEYTMFCVDISLKRDGSSIDEIQTAYSRNFTVVGNIYENPELFND